MRTTVTLDDDTASRVHELARVRRASFKETLNDLLRAGLAALDTPAATDAPFVVHPHRGGFRPGVDPLRLNELVDQLATEAFIRESSR